MTTFQEMGAIYSGRYKHKLNKMSETLFQTFKLNYFFYLYVSPQRRCTFIGSDPDLIQNYIDAKMHYYNPFFVKTEHVKTGLYLYNSVQNGEFQTSMQLLEKKYKAKHCALLTRNDQRGCVIYGFATPPQIIGIETLLCNQAALMRNFTHYFESEMKPILHKMAEQPVDMHSQLDVFVKQTEVDLPKIHFDKDEFEVFLKAYSPELAFSFTKRERDVIKVFLKGKTAREIAEDLSLSHRTVQHYLENIKNKLCCETKSEMFASLQKFNSSLYFD